MQRDMPEMTVELTIMGARWLLAQTLLEEAMVVVATRHQMLSYLKAMHAIGDPRIMSLDAPVPLDSA